MMTYGTDRRGSIPPYNIARQFYSPRPPTHASAYAPAWGSAWANWLAYNMGMARLLWSAIILKNSLIIKKR